MTLDDKVRALTDDIGRGRDTDRLTLRFVKREAAPWHTENRYTTSEAIEVETKSGAVIRIDCDVMNGIDVSVTRDPIDGRIEVGHMYFNDEYRNPVLVNVRHYDKGE